MPIFQLPDFSAGKAWKLPQPNLPPPIRTPEESLRWCEDVIADVVECRAKIDLVELDRTFRKLRGTGPALRKLYSIYCLKHGYALGVLQAELRSGRLTPLQHDTLQQKVKRSMHPAIRSGG